MNKLKFNSDGILEHGYTQVDGILYHQMPVSNSEGNFEDYELYYWSEANFAWMPATDY